MDEKTRNQITNTNEKYVCAWFEESGFTGQKLDSHNGRQGKSADWRFSKSALAVICEVKTIFSGGQSGLTPEQYERRRLEFIRKVDYHKAQAQAEGESLIVDQDELDYIEGKTSYPRRTLTKEEAFNDFLEAIRKRLMGDQSINQLPFSISISIDALYVVYREERQRFIKRLRDIVLWASKQHIVEWPYSKHTYEFVEYRREENGEVQHEIEAFVQVIGPSPDLYPDLQVQFHYGGVQYNEEAIAKTIEEGWGQLQASIRGENSQKALPVIALWSDSNYFSFLMLLMMDAVGAQLHDLPQRYYLIDWAFLEYSDLAAIILFELKREGDFSNPTPNDRQFPIAFVITNPALPDAEKDLRKAITENCMFVAGIGSDPSKEPIM